MFIQPKIYVRSNGDGGNSVSYNVLRLQEVGDFHHKCSYKEPMFVEPQNYHTKH